MAGISWNLLIEREAKALNSQAWIIYNYLFPLPYKMDKQLLFIEDMAHVIHKQEKTLTMNRVNKSIFIFGVYSLLMGFILLLVPNSILPIVGMPVSNEPWPYLLGFVLMCSSYYYLRSAWKGNIDFARYTTHARFAAPVIVIFLIVAGKADYHFLSFGIIDGLGGLWTWIELNRNRS